MSETRDVEEFRAYYYSLYGTGESAIDGVLRAVARAGKAYHNTSGWTDEPYGDPDGPSEVEKIQAAANEAAAEIRRLRSELEEANEAYEGAVAWTRAELARRDAALREAFREGWKAGFNDGLSAGHPLSRRIDEVQEEAEDWEDSDARRALAPVADCMEACVAETGRTCPQCAPPPVADQTGEADGEGRCGLCGEPMPEGEEMFRYHGYSGPCPTTEDQTGGDE